MLGAASCLSLLMVQTWLIGSDSLYADSENHTCFVTFYFQVFLMNSDALVT